MQRKSTSIAVGEKKKQQTTNKQTRLDMQTASLKNSGALSLVINIEMIPFFFKFIPVSTQIDLDLGWLLFLLFPTSWPEYKMKKKLKEVTQKRKRWTRLEGQTANQRRRRRSGDRWRLFFAFFSSPSLLFFASIASSLDSSSRL